MQPQLLHDRDGKPSTMRAGALMAVATGCAMLLLASLGYGDPDLAEEALWLVGLAFGGKAVQRVSEGGRAGEPK